MNFSACVIKCFSYCYVGFLVAVMIRIVPNALESAMFILAFLFGFFLVIIKWDSFRGIGHSKELSILIMPWLFLGLWYVVGIDWSRVGLRAGLILVNEYRLLFVVPLFSVALLLAKPRFDKILRIVVFSAAIGTLALYAFHLEVIQELLPLLRPRGSYIISGSISAVTMILAGCAIKFLKWRVRVMIFIIIAAAIHVVGLDVGRTGYLQILFVFVVWILLSKLSGSQKIAVFLSLLLGLVVVVALSSMTLDRVILVSEQLRAFHAGDLSETSVGNRLQWWIFASNAPGVSLLSGVGLHEYVSGIAHAVETGSLQSPTDNLHSEVMNSLYIGGGIGLSLFLACLTSWIFILCRFTRENIWFAASLATVVLVGSIFNSVFKDFGEKNLWMAVWPLLIYSFFSNCSDAATDD